MTIATWNKVFSWRGRGGDGLLLFYDNIFHVQQLKMYFHKQIHPTGRFREGGREGAYRYYINELLTFIYYTYTNVLQCTAQFPGMFC